MHDSDRITELLVTLGHLTEAQKAGFQCHYEMNKVVDALMNELKLSKTNEEE